MKGVRTMVHAASPSPSPHMVRAAMGTLELDHQLNLDLGAVDTAKSALGVFGPNKSAPLHRWVSLTEGFSAELVLSELANASPGSVVLDPFGGTGTTPLVAAQLGHHGIWAEVNPYLRETAEVKVAAACAEPSLRLQVSRALQEALLAGRCDPKHHDRPLIEADDRRAFFPAGTAMELVGWVERFGAIESTLARRLGRLAVASCVISVSNMKRAVDLRRRTEAELERPRPSVAEAIRDRIAEFSADLEGAPMASGSARCVSSDARDLPRDLEPVDLVVTSPPYLNGTNYVRNTKLELLLLELITSERDLGTLRTRAVTAGINNVSKRIASPRRLDCVEPVARRLDDVAYDNRIPKMVRAYFGDMRTVLATTRRVMRQGGRLVLDIGDSRFAGVHIDTPQLLCEIAESVGWVLDATTVLRSRTAKDGTPLCQKLLYLSSP